MSQLALGSEFGKQHITSGSGIPLSDTRGTHKGMPPNDASIEAQKQMENPPRNHSASPQRRAIRSGGSLENNATEHSPLRHHHQARVTNKVGGFSPSRERKSSMEGGHGGASNVPGKSPLRVSSRPDESPEDGTLVPKFGVWDDANPSSGEAFTGIFNKVSEEKQSSAAKVPMITDDSIYLNSFHHDSHSHKPTKFCCFNWGRK